jgi:predicted DNA-binding ribbon-helix-helix protein
MKKRSVLIAGHRTSLSLEDEFFDELRSIADVQGRSVNALLTELDAEGSGNLSSKARVYVLSYLKE